MCITSFEARSRMTKNSLGCSFTHLKVVPCTSFRSPNWKKRSIRDKKQKQNSDFKIIVTDLDRERIKIGTDFTPYFVPFGNFIYYFAHHYKFLFMTLLIDRIDCSLYTMLLTLSIQAQYSNLPLKLTLKWVYHIFAPHCETVKCWQMRVMHCGGQIAS